MASAHMGAAYNMVDVTTVAIILLLCCFGPRVFAVILEMAAVDLDALAAAYVRCARYTEQDWEMCPKDVEGHTHGWEGLQDHNNSCVVQSRCSRKIRHEIAVVRV